MTISSKTYSDLTVRERAKLSKLTPTEHQAVSNLVAAVRALPGTIILELEDFEFPALAVYKRITSGSCIKVRSIRKKSLFL